MKKKTSNQNLRHENHFLLFVDANNIYLCNRNNDLKTYFIKTMEQTETTFKGSTKSTTKEGSSRT